MSSNARFFGPIRRLVVPGCARPAAARGELNGLPREPLLTFEVSSAAKSVPPRRDAPAAATDTGPVGFEVDIATGSAGPMLNSRLPQLVCQGDVAP